MPRIASPKGPTIAAPDVIPEQVDHATSSVYLNRHFNNHMVSRIDGNSWVGTYYSKFHGNDDVVTSDDDSDDATLIQYLKVMNLELRVQSDLSAQFNEEQGTMLITGSANVYPIMIPTVGDVWVAQYGEGRVGIFSVTNARPLSMYKEAAYSIEYTLTAENASVEELQALDDKVVETLYFDLTRMENRGGPLLTMSEWDRENEKINTREELIVAYCTRFYDNHTQTFKLPDDNYYDPHLVEFWHKTVEVHECAECGYPRLQDRRHGMIKTNYLTVFDAFLKTSIALFKHSMVKSMNKVLTGGYGGMWIYHALNTSKFARAVQPFLNEGNPIRTLTGVNDEISPYIFTEAFYNETLDEMEPFERFVYNVINGQQVVDYRDLKAAAGDLINFSADDEKLFYQIPFLLALMKIAR